MKTSLLITNNEWLKDATRKLIIAGIKSAPLDSLIILSFCLKVSKIEILTNPTRTIPNKKIKLVNRFLAKRLEHYPISYLIKQVEFYGRTFYIDSRVLSPRPESEAFINILKLSDISNLRYLTDVGCGSGILGITSKLEFPHLDIEFLDNSRNALKVASLNIDNFKIESIIRLSDIINDSDYKFDIILANLPYIPYSTIINKAAGHEPKMAIFAHDNGLYFYKILIKQLTVAKKSPKHILIECLESQIVPLTKLFNNISYKLTASDGLVHRFSK
ncbi:MAG TPA: HemK/PrmC family methyltransferase [Candidatus Dormibacteraeota bacterium]|nr:HemK/PrmC family methyltransferase [Candidatus Dormibacteraeota bacterium]